MNKSLTVFCAAALFAAGAFADDDEDTSVVTSDEAATEESTEDASAKKDDYKWFFTLPLCRRVQGRGEVQKPGESEWQKIEEGRFYPLGSSFRASPEKSLIVISFGKSCSVTIENGSVFSTRQQALSEPSRTVILKGGDIKVVLPGNLKAGLFNVTTPGLTVCNMCGESKFTYTDKGDGFEVDIRCVTGEFAINGRHYQIPKMSAADVLRVRTTHDELETILYGKSGDYIVKLDKGSWFAPETQDDGTVKDTVQTGALDWHLSVDTRVQINRGVPSVGERMSVSMMTFDTTGAMKNHFAFAEKRPEVNTGELIPRPRATDADAAKSAAEATTEAAAEAETVAAEEEETTPTDSDL